MIEVEVKGQPIFRHIDNVEIEPRYMDAGFTVWMETNEGELLSVDIESLKELKIRDQKPN